MSNMFKAKRRRKRTKKSIAQQRALPFNSAIIVSLRGENDLPTTNMYAHTHTHVIGIAHILAHFIRIVPIMHVNAIHTPKKKKSKSVREIEKDV